MKFKFFFDDKHHTQSCHCRHLGGGAGVCICLTLDFKVAKWAGSKQAGFSIIYYLKK